MHQEGAGNGQAERFTQNVCVQLLEILPQPLHIAAAVGMTLSLTVPAPAMATPQPHPLAPPSHQR